MRNKKTANERLIEYRVNTLDNRSRGSDKHFSFRLEDRNSDCLHVFESVIDLSTYIKNNRRSVGTGAVI